MRVKWLNVDKNTYYLSEILFLKSHFRWGIKGVTILVSVSIWVSVSILGMTIMSGDSIILPIAHCITSI